MMLLVENNLLMALSVTETAERCGVAVVTVGSLSEATTRLGDPKLTHVLVSMGLATPQWVLTIPSQIRVAAYGPHVEGEKFIQFRQAGVKNVWPHSRIRDKLPVWLNQEA